MRWGLVVVGLVFAVVGAGLVTSFFVDSSGAPPGALTRTITASVVGPNQTQDWSLATVGTSHGSLTLSWSSTVPVNVNFWRTESCASSTGVCAVLPALGSWDANSSGEWRGTGSVGSTYLLTVTGRSSAASFNATLTESYQGTPFDLGTPGIVLITIGSILLLGTGGVAVFLGLFLPGGVYQNPPVERGARRGYEDSMDDGGEFEDGG